MVLCLNKLLVAHQPWCVYSTVWGKGGRDGTEGHVCINEIRVYLKCVCVFRGGWMDVHRSADAAVSVLCSSFFSFSHPSSSPSTQSMAMFAH